MNVSVLLVGLTLVLILWGILQAIRALPHLWHMRGGGR